MKPDIQKNVAIGCAVIIGIALLCMALGGAIVYFYMR